MTRIFRSLHLTPLASALILAVIMFSSFSIASHTGGALASIAHAGTLEAPPTVAPDAPADSGFGLLGYVVIAVAVIGGALRILDVLIPGLRWLAPRTKTKLDDDALAMAQGAHDRLDQVESVLLRLARLTPPPGVVSSEITVKTSKTPQGGFVRVYTMIGVAAIGLLACAALKVRGEALEAGVVTCTKADKPKVQALALQLGTEALAGFLQTGTIPWDRLKTDAEAAAESQGIDVAACAFDGLLADLEHLLHPTAVEATSALTADVFGDPTDPLGGGRAAFASFRGAHGITRVVH
jgi:hypothetical protein